MKKGWIYIIRNTVNNKVYIGQTRMTVKLRFQDHLSAARHDKDYVIGKAIRKYGEDKFYVDYLDFCNAGDSDELTKLLNAKECYWIDFFDSTNTKYGYNISKGGNKVRTTKSIDEEQVITAFKSGTVAYLIAKELHVGVPRISAILRKHNIAYGREKQRRQDESKIIESYLNGINTMSICRMFAINKSTVRRIIIRNNIYLRKRSKNKNSERNPQTL